MTLESLYKLWMENNPDSKLSYQEWLDLHSQKLGDAIKNIDPYISDNFMIGPDGAYERTDEDIKDWDVTLLDGIVDEEDFPTKPGFVERRMALGKAQNNKDWDAIYESYKGVSDLHDFVDWLKQNYIAPEKI